MSQKCDAFTFTMLTLLGQMNAIALQLNILAYLFISLCAACHLYFSFYVTLSRKSFLCYSALWLNIKIPDLTILCINFFQNRSLLNFKVSVLINFCIIFFQFLAAPDKLSFLFEIFSLVDYFTIPPSFVAVYLNRNWLGKKSLTC